MEIAPRSVASYCGNSSRPEAAGRVDAGAGLVDDHVGHALVFQLLLDQIGEEILGVAAGRAVADDDHGELVLLDHFQHLLPGFAAAVGLAHQIDHALAEQVAELVERRQLAAAAKTGIDRQQAVVVDRRLQEQVAKILGEHAHRVRLGVVGQLAADFALQAGQNQAAERVAGAAAEVIGMGMLRRNEHFLEHGRHRLQVRLDLAPATPSPARRG